MIYVKIELFNGLAHTGTVGKLRTDFLGRQINRTFDCGAPLRCARAFGREE
jgi:hypothetical protein